MSVLLLRRDEEERGYQETVEPTQEEVGGSDLLIGDLLSLDYPAPTPSQASVAGVAPVQQQPVADLLGDIFSGMSVSN